MREIAVVLAGVSLFACSQPDGEAAPEGAEVATAALGYAGSDYDGDAEKLAHGERLAVALGCQNCHGADYRGGNVTELEPALGNIYAPNLALLLPDYSDEELDQAIRHGAPKDGRGMIFMPSEMYRLMTDADYAALVAHLRTVEPGGEAMPPIEPSEALFEAAAAWGILPGEDGRPYYADMRAVEAGDDHAMGRYIAETACTECHKADLTGLPGFSPDLSIAGTYERDEFANLLKTGKGKTRDDLGYMSWAAAARFGALTDEEVTALYDYLVARGNVAAAN